VSTVGQATVIIVLV